MIRTVTALSPTQPSFSPDIPTWHWKVALSRFSLLQSSSNYPPSGRQILKFGLRKWRHNLPPDASPPRRPCLTMWSAHSAPNLRLKSVIYSSDPPNTLKAELIKRTAASAQRKLQQPPLAAHQRRGTRRPKAYSAPPQNATATRWSTGCWRRHQRLPQGTETPCNVRMVIASADVTTDIAKLADMADKVLEVANTVSAVRHSTNTDEVDKLREEVTRLADLVASLTSTHSRGPRSRSNSRHRRPRSPAPLDKPEPLCWYHHKFGEEARKCQEPCSWGNSQAGP